MSGPLLPPVNPRKNYQWVAPQSLGGSFDTTLDPRLSADLASGRLSLGLDYSGGTGGTLLLRFRTASGSRRLATCPLAVTADPPIPGAPVLQVGFGAGFYTDAGLAAPAAADGDLVYTAEDPVGGNHLTQSASGQRPQLDLYTFDAPSLLFRSWRADYLSIPNTPVLDARDFTLCLLIARHSTCLSPGTPIYYQSSGTSAGRLLSYVTHPRFSNMFNWTGPGDTHGSEQVDYGAQAVVLVSDGSALTLYVNGVAVVASAAVTAGSVYGGWLGALAGNYPAHVAVAGMLQYDSALAGADLAALHTFAAAYANVGTTFPASAAAFVFIGDSLTAGTGVANDAGTHPYQALAALTNAATYLRSHANLGVPGATTADWATAGNQAYVNGFYDAARPGSVLFVWTGTNDSNYSTAAPAVKQVCQDFQDAGWTVVVLDMLPRQDTPDTPRQTFNASLAGDFPTSPATRIRAGASYATYLLQIGSDPTIGLAGSEDNATYYQGDKLHLTAAGEGVVAGYETTALQLLGYS